MAERGKAEESQRTEAPYPSQDELLQIVDHIETVFGESVSVRFSVQAPATDSSNADVLVEARPARAKAKAAEPRIEVTAAVPSDLEPEEAVDRNDAYYDEVRRAVGRGTPSVLLGTSTKSLERNLQKVRLLESSDRPASSPPVSPSARRGVLLPVERSSIWWKLTVTGVWALTLLVTASVITDPSPPAHGWSHLGWFQILQAIAILIFLWAIAIVISVPRLRRGAKAWIGKKCSPDRSYLPKWPGPPKPPRK
jgi:hypothetical protein